MKLILEAQNIEVVGMHSELSLPVIDCSDDFYAGEEGYYGLSADFTEYIAAISLPPFSENIVYYPEAPLCLDTTAMWMDSFDATEHHKIPRKLSVRVASLINPEDVLVGFNGGRRYLTLNDISLSSLEHALQKGVGNKTFLTLQDSKNYEVMYHPYAIIGMNTQGHLIHCNLRILQGDLALDNSYGWLNTEGFTPIILPHRTTKYTGDYGQKMLKKFEEQ